MYNVVNADDGTAGKARNRAISLAGKTGTAEITDPRDKHKNTWFICYGPVDDPDYALAILIQRGQSGGQTAAPLAAEFFRRWLGARRNHPRS